MSVSSSAKRARLSGLRHAGPHASYSAIEALLLAAKRDGVPEHVSRRTQHRARKTEAIAATPYGPLLVDVELPFKDGAQAVTFAHPLAMLWLCARDSAPFAAVLASTLAKHPPEAAPWHIIFYNDEIGLSPLKYDSRKVEVCYWSFLEFGPAALGAEELWFCITAVRSSRVCQLPAGISHVTKAALRLFLVGDHNIERGVMLEVRGQHVCLIAKYACHISDEKAIKETFCTKGASGSKPCPLCMNIVGIDSRLAGAYCKTIACDDATRFVLHSDESVRELVREIAGLARGVADGTVRKAKLEEKQQLYGLNHEEHSIMLDVDLRVGLVSVMMFDFMHVFFVTGLYNFELFNLFEYLKHQQVTHSMLEKFASRFTFPRCYAAGNLFVEHNWGSDHWKGSASEGLAGYAIVVLFLDSVCAPMGVCKKQIASFVALGLVLDLLSMLKSSAVASDELARAIASHLKACKAAYGDIVVRPKHHMAMHLGNQLARHAMLLSCFVHERRHKLIKRFMQDRRSLLSYERGLMEDVTLHHIHELAELQLEDSLVGASAACSKLLEAMRAFRPLARDVQSASRMRVNGLHAGVRDVVLAMVDGVLAVGELWYCVSLDKDVLCCISLWERVAACTEEHCSTRVFRPRERPAMLAASQVLAPAVFVANRAGDLVTVIVPPFLRAQC